MDKSPQLIFINNERTRIWTFNSQNPTPDPNANLSSHKRVSKLAWLYDVWFKANTTSLQLVMRYEQRDNLI